MQSNPGNDTMTAVVCEAPGKLTLTRRATPVRAEDEVLLRIRRVGVCGTDMHILRGTQPYLSYPRIMGHELAAEVVEAPSAEFAGGDPVFVMPYMSCGRCGACTKGKPNCCRNLQVLGVHRDGGMAEFLSVPRQFVRRADGLSLDQIAMVEFLSIGAHAVARGTIRAGEQVLVLGAGPIGMAVMLFARLQGARVAALDTRMDRLEFCRGVLGIDEVVVAGPGAPEWLTALTRGEMFDAVFDATGNLESMESGFAHVGHGGRYVFVSIVQGEVRFSDPEFHRRETTLLGSRNATFADVDRVMQAMRDGLIPTAELNTHRAPLAQVPAMLPAWMQPEAGVVKAIVEC
jgi:2-desacetyl-2-hydroxyethyl bacteriochlorophyllide A dehydrogenase